MLKEVKYVHELWVNLFSINKALKNGFKLRNNGVSICPSKGSVSISFDQIISTTNGLFDVVKICAIQSYVVHNAIFNTIFFT